MYSDLANAADKGFGDSALIVRGMTREVTQVSACLDCRQIALDGWRRMILCAFAHVPNLDLHRRRLQPVAPSCLARLSAMVLVPGPICHTTASRVVSAPYVFSCAGFRMPA